MYMKSIGLVTSTAFISKFSWSGVCVNKINKNHDYVVSWKFSDNIIISGKKNNISVNYDQSYVTDLQNIFRINA